jgi:hypothetical protein
MLDKTWMKSLPMNLIVCDKDFVITEMNQQAMERYAAEGGSKLIGKSLLDCHNPESREKIKKIAENCQPNVYYVNKNGVQKLVFQAPIVRNSAFYGLVELVLTLPKDIPLVNRD